MRVYAVIDTNVIVSAMLKRDSIPGNILELALEGIITPVFSAEILKEYQTVLLREKFHFSETIVGDLIDTLKDKGESVEAGHLDLEFADPKDIVFYEVVMEKRNAEDAYLVTGNIKHFPKERFVVTPREMFEILLREAEKER